MKGRDILNRLESMRETAFFLREQAQSQADHAASLEESIQSLINEISQPSQIEYDRSQLDAPPRPVQPALEDSPEVFCHCGEHAKRVEKVGRNNKPYVAYACARPKGEGCDFWVFENQLQKA